MGEGEFIEPVVQSAYMLILHLLLILFEVSGTDCYERPHQVQSDVKRTRTKTDSKSAVIYQIRLKGHLGSQWTDWFGGLTITLEEDGDTLLTGPVIDQAALFGLLKKVRDLGMPLVSVSPLEPGPADA